MILGITGGSGSGKTTLLRLLADQGAMVLDCDGIYHDLLRQDNELLSRIAARFPGVVQEGTLQRKKLGAIVFADPQALSALNAITHAAVKKEVQRRLESRPPLAAIDAIGLLEGGLAELCDITVAVTAPRQDRIRRLMAREGISDAYAAARIDAQPQDQEFEAQCDYVLRNEGSLAQFQKKCLVFFQRIGLMRINASERSIFDDDN